MMIKDCIVCGSEQPHALVEQGRRIACNRCGVRSWPSEPDPHDTIVVDVPLPEGRTTTIETDDHGSRVQVGGVTVRAVSLRVRDAHEATEARIELTEAAALRAIAARPDADGPGRVVGVAGGDGERVRGPCGAGGAVSAPTLHQALAAVGLTSRARPELEGAMAGRELFDGDRSLGVYTARDAWERVRVRVSKEQSR